MTPILRRLSTVLSCILYQKICFSLCNLYEVSPWACCWLVKCKLFCYKQHQFIYDKEVCLGLNGGQADMCMCSFDINGKLILLFISSVMMWAWFDSLKSAYEWTWFYIFVFLKKLILCFKCFIKFFFFHVSFFQSFLCIICVTGQGTYTEGLCEKRFIFFLSNKQKNWIDSHVCLSVGWVWDDIQKQVIKQIFERNSKTRVHVMTFIYKTLWNPNMYTSQRTCQSSLAKNRNEVTGVDPQWLWTLVKLMQRPWTQQKTDITDSQYEQNRVYYKTRHKKATNIHYLPKYQHNLSLKRERAFKTSKMCIFCIWWRNLLHIHHTNSLFLRNALKMHLHSNFLTSQGHLSQVEHSCLKWQIAH